MKILHVCAGWEKWNGAANIARMIMDGQRREGHEVAFATWAKVRDLRAADEVWIHCGWMPCLWWAAVNFSISQFVGLLTSGERRRALKWMPEACYDPVRLKFHGWKKWLVGPIERWCLRRCDRIVAACEAEKVWIEKYLGKKRPPIEVMDVKRFFDFSHKEQKDFSHKEHKGFSYKGHKEEKGHKEDKGNRGVHLLYLGRRHPLKGVEYLESAVGGLQCASGDALTQRRRDAEIELRLISNAFGEEKEKVWEWCDVLALPTLSDNFGLVIAEALERGKCVITTDGAPAWGDGNDYGGRLVYLRGYRDGSPEERVWLLKTAIERFVEA